MCRVFKKCQKVTKYQQVQYIWVEHEGGWKKTSNYILNHSSMWHSDSSELSKLERGETWWTKLALMPSYASSPHRLKIRGSSIHRGFWINRRLCVWVCVCVCDSFWTGSSLILELLSVAAFISLTCSRIAQNHVEEKDFSFICMVPLSL